LFQTGRPGDSYRRVIRPTIKGGATVMDEVFGDPDEGPEN
jgi:hypothetical protein